MAHNPYSAPNTTVADVSAEPPMERPRIVVIAVMLLWTEFTLGLLDSVLGWKDSRAAQKFWEFSIVISAIFVIISVWINIKVWQGRNWARIVALVLTGFAVISFAPQMSASFARSALLSTLYCIEILLDVAAMILVFGPGRRWFAQR